MRKQGFPEYNNEQPTESRDRPIQQRRDSDTVVIPTVLAPTHTRKHADSTNTTDEALAESNPQEDHEGFDMASCPPFEARTKSLGSLLYPAIPMLALFLNDGLSTADRNKRRMPRGGKDGNTTAGHGLQRLLKTV